MAFCRSRGSSKIIHIEIGHTAACEIDNRNVALRARTRSGRNFSKLGRYSLSVWETYIRWAVPEIVNCLAKPADAVRYRVSRVRWHR
jgi:hypothetical protein